MKNENLTIILNTPIKRGEKSIESIELRVPKAGELRGIKLLDVVQMDTAAYEELIPRISTPSLTKQEFGQLSLPDVAQIMNRIGGMFEGKPSAKA